MKTDNTLPHTKGQLLYYICNRVAARVLSDDYVRTSTAVELLYNRLFDLQLFWNALYIRHQLVFIRGLYKGKERKRTEI